MDVIIYIRETLHEDNLSWRAGIDWRPADNALLYANIARGYKAGSFPTLSSGSFTSYLPVVQESVLSYEAGLKATFLDGSFDIDLAGFYYDYSDKQLLSKLQSPVFGILDVLQNIPKSSVRGVELSMTARPTRGFAVNVSAAIIKATVDRFTGINGAGVAGDFGGTPLPFTPRYQVRISPEYRFSLSDRAIANIGGSLSWRSNTITIIGGNSNFAGAQPIGRTLSEIREYTLVDLHVGVTFDDRYTLSVFGKNVTNTYYWDNVVTSSDTLSRSAGRPATYGVSLGLRY